MEPLQTNGPDASASPAGDLIKDTTTQTFAADVLDASKTVPVIVDFWAPWCGPCKQLGPALEKVVAAAQGAVKLVKMNIDEHPQVAQQLRVQSIPAVFAFKDGQPVDGFAGALPESQVRQFVERLAGAIGPTPAEQMLEAAAETLAGGDLAQAAQLYAQIIQQEPDNAAAIGGLAHCYIRSGDLQRARQTLGLAPPEKSADPAIAGAEAALALAEKSADVGDLAPLLARLDANPKDHQARFDLAIGLNAQGDRAAAIDHLLTLVQNDRTWNDEAARKQLVEFFDAYGPADDLTVSGRRRLSSILFS